MVKRFIALTAVLTMLTIGTVTPRPARADVVQALTITAIALGAYVGIVILCTTLIYRTAPPLPEPQQLADGEARGRRGDVTAGVRLGRHCRQDGGDLTLLCW